MTREDLIPLIEEAVICHSNSNPFDFRLLTIEAVERFAALVAAAEREACAEIADKELDNTMLLTSYPPKSSAAWNIRAAIRARGER